jgi:hypothetical protein
MERLTRRHTDQVLESLGWGLDLGSALDYHRVPREIRGAVEARVIAALGER